MATAEALLRIKVVTDATAAAAGLDKQSKSAGRFGSAMRKAALPAAAVVGGLVAIGKSAVDSASQLQQAEGAVEAVFGNQADAVKKAAGSAATTMGLSASQYENYAALVGTALQNAGLSVKDSVTESGKVMQRGADLSALYGGTTADAVEAINAAVSRSEFDPLEKYGVSLNMTAVNAELAAKGQDKLTGKQLEAAKKAIILEEVYKKSAKAAGQYGREAGSAAGQQQTASAQWENAAATLGTVLLPIVAKATGQLAKLATWMQKNATLVQILAGVLGAVALTILAVNAAMTAWTVATKIASAATKVWTGIQWLFNAAMSANPIGIVIVLIVALVAAIVIAYKKSDTFRRIVQAAFKAVSAAARAVANVIKTVFQVAWKLVTAYVKAYLLAVRLVLTGIRTAITAIGSWLRSKWQAIWSGASSIVKTQIGHVKDTVNGVKDAITNVTDALKSTWETVWKNAKTAAVNAFNPIKTAVDAVKTAIDHVSSAISGLISWIGRIKWPSPPKFLSKIPGNPLGLSAPAPPVPGRRGYVAAPTVGGLAAGRRASASSGTTIVVNGALDPEAVARQIGRILDGHERRVGLRTT